jgi:phage terminase large subunit-like protein
VFQPVVRMDHEGNLYSLNKCFIDQYQRYPYVNHDDDLDCVSRIFDMEPAPPVVLEQMLLEPEVFVDS